MRSLKKREEKKVQDGRIKNQKLKRRNKFDKSKLEFEKLVYWCVLVVTPLVIGAVTHITDASNDETTRIFFIITLIMYIAGVMLSASILDINIEFKKIYKEYTSTVLTYTLSPSEKYEELQDIVEYCKLNVAKTVFKNFNKSLKIKNVIVDGEETKIYYMTADVECFFNEDNIIYKNVYMKVINQIIQSLTGVGIFGTFLGIIQGVNGLQLDDNDYIRQSIIELLSGIKVSFNSSLYGIMFSMILVLALKFIIDRTMKNVYRISEYINEILNVYTEQQAVDDLNEEIRKQTELLEKIMDKLDDGNIIKNY